MAKKIYRFEVRKIVSCYYEVEALNQKDAFDELRATLFNEETLADYWVNNLEFLVGADAKLVGKNKKWRHVNGKTIAEIDYDYRAKSIWT